MVLITGPLFSGKRTFAKKRFGLQEYDFAPEPRADARAVYEAQQLVSGLPEEALPLLAEQLCQYDFVLMTEVGCGVVPASPFERDFREKAGRLAIMLAERADTVVQLWCGLPTVLKGKLTL